jgi:hypothetical protein
MHPVLDTERIVPNFRNLSVRPDVRLKPQGPV